MRAEDEENERAAYPHVSKNIRVDTLVLCFVDDVSGLFSFYAVFILPSLSGSRIL